MMPLSSEELIRDRGEFEEVSRTGAQGSFRQTSSQTHRLGGFIRDFPQPWGNRIEGLHGEGLPHFSEREKLVISLRRNAGLVSYSKHDEPDHRSAHDPCHSQQQWL